MRYGPKLNEIWSKTLEAHTRNVDRKDINSRTEAKYLSNK